MALNGAPDQKTKETGPKRPTLTSQKPPSDPSRRRQAKNSRFFEVSSLDCADDRLRMVEVWPRPAPWGGAGFYGIITLAAPLNAAIHCSSLIRSRCCSGARSSTASSPCRSWSRRWSWCPAAAAWDSSPRPKASFSRISYNGRHSGHRRCVDRYSISISGERSGR